MSKEIIECSDPQAYLKAIDTNNNFTLSLLSQHKDYFVRARVARNSNTQIPTLEYLADDEHHAVRAGVAGHWRTPAIVVKKIAEQELHREKRSWQVFTMVATNHRVPASILRALFASGDWNVLCSLAWNKSCPLDLLQKLAGSPDEVIQAVVRKRLGFLPLQQKREPFQSLALRILLVTILGTVAFVLFWHGIAKMASF